MPENQVRQLLIDHGFVIANMSYRVTQAGLFEYSMDIRTGNPRTTSSLAKKLRETESVREFRISTTGY